MILTKTNSLTQNSFIRLRTHDKNQRRVHSFPVSSRHKCTLNHEGNPCS